MPPYDPGQTSGDRVIRSFSDSDLRSVCRRLEPRGGTLASLRLGNLVAPRLLVSVDTYVEETLTGGRVILIRGIGGEVFWPHGPALVQDLCGARVSRWQC